MIRIYLSILIGHWSIFMTCYRLSRPAPTAPSLSHLPNSIHNNCDKNPHACTKFKHGQVEVHTQFERGTKSDTFKIWTQGYECSDQCVLLITTSVQLVQWYCVLPGIKSARSNKVRDSIRNNSSCIRYILQHNDHQNHLNCYYYGRSVELDGDDNGWEALSDV